jgi:hypothetical protein
MLEATTVLAFVVLTAGPGARFVDESPCSGCLDSISSNFDGTGLLVGTGPLGSSVRIQVTGRDGGVCNPDCTVEGICSFALDYKVEFGPHGIAWERTDSVRSEGGQVWANQGVKRIAPHAGFEVEDTIGPIDVSCGFQMLYWIKLWFDQPVSSGIPGAPNIWVVGPASVICSSCSAPD